MATNECGVVNASAEFNFDRRRVANDNADNSGSAADNGEFDEGIDVCSIVAMIDFYSNF